MKPLKKKKREKRKGGKDEKQLDALKLAKAG